TYATFRTAIGNVDPNGQAKNSCITSANLQSPCQENDARLLLITNGVCQGAGCVAPPAVSTPTTTTTGFLGRSLYWGSSGRFQAAVFTKGGTVGSATIGNIASVDGKSPTVANVGNGTYPIRRLLYNVTRNDFDTTGPGMAAVAMAKWICLSSHATNDETG